MMMSRTSWLAVLMTAVMPLAAASPAGAQPFAYVVGQREPAGTTAIVSVIDRSTGVRVASIPVGANCLCLSPDSIAIAHDVGRLYVTNEFAQTVSVIDIASNTVVATIAVGTSPTAVVAKPDGSRVYVLNGSGAAAVAEIETATNAIVAITPLGVAQARGMAITSDGEHLYVSTFGTDSVIVVETAEMSVTATIPVGPLPVGVDITPDGSRAYVAAFSSNAVYAIDTSTNAVVATIPVGVGPQSARITPDGSRVYVANTVSKTVSIIDTKSNAVETVQLTDNPRTLDFAPDGTRAYVANSLNVQVIDTATNAVIDAVAFVAATDGYPASLVIGRGVGGNPPTAVNESFATNRNTPLHVPAPGVLANDHRDGGGSMTAALVSNVTQGMLGLNADGSFTYTPAPGFSGTDSFTYRAINAVGASNVATVTLSVVTGPQPPAGLYVSNTVGNTVTLRWTPPVVGDTPTGYLLEGGVNPGEVLASVPTNNTAPTFTLVAPTGAFYIRMHTLSGANKSAASKEIRLIVNVPAAPSAPANLLGGVNGADLSLAWRNTFLGGTPADLLLQVTGSISATLPLPLVDGVSFAGVPAGTYTLRLRAVNAAGTSGLSNPVTLTFPGPCSGVPQAPANVLAWKNGSVISVVWNSARRGPAPTSFVVNVSGSFVGSFPTTERSVSGAAGPGTYVITVSATNACGTSPPTAAQTVVIP